jgi:hypothetical protein
MIEFITNRKAIPANSNSVFQLRNYECWRCNRVMIGFLHPLRVTILCPSCLLEVL